MDIEWAEALVVPRVVMVMFVLNGLVSLRFFVLVFVVSVMVCVAVAPVAVVAEVSSMSIRVSIVDDMIELVRRAHVVRLGVSVTSVAIAAVATISAGTVVECSR